MSRKLKIVNNASELQPLSSLPESLPIASNGAPVSSLEARLNTISRVVPSSSESQRSITASDMQWLREEMANIHKEYSKNPQPTTFNVMGAVSGHFGLVTSKYLYKFFNLF